MESKSLDLTVKSKDLDSMFMPSHRMASQAIFTHLTKSLHGIKLCQAYLNNIKIKFVN